MGRTVHVREGAVRLEDGTLAGSALTIDRGVRNLVALAGLRWTDAIRMATLTPATILGLADRKGRIAPGCDADLVALDAQGRVYFASKSQIWMVASDGTLTLVAGLYGQFDITGDEGPATAAQIGFLRAESRAIDPGGNFR
mgnify:CR=1 FL=1